MNNKNFIELKEIGQTIQYFREGKKLSIKQLCGNQISEKTIRNIEKGQSNPRIETLFFLSHQLGISLNDLLSSKQNKLINQFNSEKNCVFNKFNNNEKSEILVFLEFIYELEKEIFPIEVAQEIFLYKLICEFLIMKLEEKNIDEQLCEKIRNFFQTYKFPKILEPKDVLLVTIYLQSIPNALDMKEYMVFQQTQAYNDNITVRYRENIYLLEKKQYQKIIDMTQPHFSQANMHATIAVTIMIYVQVAIAYQKLDNIEKANEYQNHAKTLLRYFPDDQLKKTIMNIKKKYV